MENAGRKVLFCGGGVGVRGEAQAGISVSPNYIMRNSKWPFNVLGPLCGETEGRAIPINAGRFPVCPSDYLLISCVP